MKTTLTRRELLKLLSAAGLGTAFASRAVADEIGATPKKGCAGASRQSLSREPD